MTYAVPAEIRTQDLTFAEVAEYFDCTDTLLDAIECLPRPDLREQALSIVTAGSKVETTGKRETCFGWYWNRNRAEHVIGLTARECDSMATMEDTFRHELAHFLDELVRGHSNHDKHWRAWATAMGCRPRATQPDKTFNRGIAQERASRTKTVARCRDCGTEWARERRKDWTGYTHKCNDGTRGYLRNVFPSHEVAAKFGHYAGGYFLEDDSEFYTRG